MKPRMRIVEQQNDRTIALRRIADRIEGSEFDDDEVTRPGVEPVMPARASMVSVADGTEVRAATFLERVLAAVSSWEKLAALVVILLAALAAFYLWKTLP